MSVASPTLRRSKRRAGRWLMIVAGASLGAIAALWVVVHRFDWAGPLVANTLRSIIGVDNVAKLEDFAYAVEDRVNRLWRRSDAPKAYWKVPPAKPAVKLSPPTSTQQANVPPRVPERPPFVPKPVGPMHKSSSAPGDGEWVPIGESMGASPYLYKTLLHPDPSRSWAELFVVAIDLERVDIELVAGSKEPQANNKAAEGYKRLAKVPEPVHASVLAAFNGGFMTEHGGWGMLTDGVTIVTPRDNGCSLFRFRDGSYKVGTFSKLAPHVADAVWFRQGPECMAENGKLHPGLTAVRARKWGATLDGETVIRRSAVGLDATGKVLLFAITNHTTAPVLARGMLHVGAPTILQMDVNWSYPKFVVFGPPGEDSKRRALALATGFEFSEDEYLRKRSIRDFFYVTPKPPGSTLPAPALPAPTLSAPSP